MHRTARCKLRGLGYSWVVVGESRVTMLRRARGVCEGDAHPSERQKKKGDRKRPREPYRGPTTTHVYNPKGGGGRRSDPLASIDSHLTPWSHPPTLSYQEAGQEIMVDYIT
jgi:hypothetical protein